MIGKNIRYLRQTHGYSQAKLAQKLNIKQASISLWENGLTTPETKYLIEMTKIFNCPMDFFLSEEQHRPLDSVAIKRAAVPIIGQIACGEPITAEQNIDGYADLPDGVRADFALFRGSKEGQRITGFSPSIAFGMFVFSYPHESATLYNLEHFQFLQAVPEYPHPFLCSVSNVLVSCALHHTS